MDEINAARIGRIHEGIIDWPELNILGRPYDRADSPPRHNIKDHAGLFVVGVNTLGKAEVEAELALLKAAVETQAEEDANVEQKPASQEAKGSGRGASKPSEEA